MRHWVLMAGLALGLAGCAGSPQAMGITGPGMTEPPPIDPLTGTSPAPGTSTPVGGYAPAVQQSPGPDGRYFNYN
ncbi:MAG: hypothetical protein KGL12_09780 [Rhodospirillales bacterium]|nr:hypothetical protein [Rhodospirillales bacterium]